MPQVFKVERTTDKYLPHRYAGASGDFNPIHIDPEFAKLVGFERNIVHGLCTLAFVAKACVDHAGGDPRSLKKLKARFAAPLLVEDAVTVTAESAGQQENCEQLELEASDGSGQQVISQASATVELT